MVGLFLFLIATGVVYVQSQSGFTLPSLGDFLVWDWDFQAFKGVMTVSELFYDIFGQFASLFRSLGEGLNLVFLAFKTDVSFPSPVHSGEVFSDFLYDVLYMFARAMRSIVVVLQFVVDLLQKIYDFIRQIIDFFRGSSDTAPSGGGGGGRH